MDAAAVVHTCLMVKSTRVSLAALTVVLLLTACAPTAPPSSPSALAPTPSPTPTMAPTQQPETGLTRPAAVFGGDCSAVFSDAEVSAIVGSATTLRAPTTEPRELSPVFTFVEQAGGLECTWDSAGAAHSVEVAIAPAGAASFPKQSGCLTLDDFSWCELDASANATRLSGRVLGQGTTEAALTVMADSLVTLFEKSAAAAAAVPVPVPAVGAWISPTDCDALVAAVDFDALLPGGPFVGGFAGGNDAYFTATDAVLRGNNTAYCGVFNPDTNAGFYFGTLGGARWNEKSLAAMPGVVVDSVPGLDVVLLRPAYGSTYVEVFDGPNWFQTSTDDPATVYPVILAIVSYLDSLAD